MNKIIDRTGERHLSNQGCWLTITTYRSARSWDIQFDDGVIIENISYKHIKDKSVKNLYHPSVYGVGYLGVGKYERYINKKATKAYDNWSSILQRCYCPKWQKNKPTYKVCSVDKRWHNFQSFAEWFYTNYDNSIMKGWDFDKDILFKGSKTYSPETCCFVPKEINSLFVKNNINRGKYPIGVTMTTTAGGIERFHATIHENGRNRSVGTYGTPEEAFQAYKIAKEEHIKEVADLWKPLIKPNVYEAMYAYEVEITD